MNTHTLTVLWVGIAIAIGLVIIIALTNSREWIGKQISSLKTRQKESKAKDGDKTLPAKKGGADWFNRVIAVVILAVVIKVSFFSDGKQTPPVQANIPTLSPPAVIVPVPSPATRWSKDQTFPTEQWKWSPRLNPDRYEVEVGLHEIMIDGNDKNVLPWDVKSKSPDVVQVLVPSYAVFIQIRSVQKDTTVYGTLYKP